jgi:metal-responsive CopG/Arc/MetJ family transcriptional regulator
MLWCKLFSMAVIEKAQVINVRLSSAQVMSVDKLVAEAREGTRGRIIRELLDEALEQREAKKAENAK